MSACVIQPIRRYLISRSRAPELVQPDDILEFTLRLAVGETRPMSGSTANGSYTDGIYQARPDVNAVCHHHAPSILPFCISGAELKPVYHLGATLGEKVPFWDARDDFGDTTLIVAKPEEGASLARALGASWIVLMRRHGATVAGMDLEELTFRTDLHSAQRGASNSGAYTRPCVAAQSEQRQNLPANTICVRVRSCAHGNTGMRGWIRRRAAWRSEVRKHAPRKDPRPEAT